MGREVIEALGETTIIVPREHLVAACTFLKTASDLEFNFLADLCGFDRGPEEEPRFEVNYHLFSTIRHHRIRLKVILAEDDIHVQTVSDIWRTANWHERETYDLFVWCLMIIPICDGYFCLTIGRVMRCERISPCEVTSHIAWSSLATESQRR